MADIQKTVEIIFAGRNDMTKAIGAMERDFGRLDGVVQGVAAPLAGVADGILKLDAALLALAIGGLALSIKKSGEFGGQFNEITTLIGDTGGSIDNFRKDILNYSVDSTKSITDINRAIYSAISAGVDYKDSVDFIAQAEKLSVAGKADLEATAKVLIGTLNAYGASTAEAAKYSDILFTTVRVGQLELAPLSMQLGKVTGIAAQTGVSFEMLSAAIAAATAYNVPLEGSVTGLKAALMNIIKPSGDAEEMAQKLGIQFNATALKTRGLDGVLADVQRSTRGNVEQIAQLFGSTEALNIVLALAADTSGKFKGAIEAMGKAAGATSEAYRKVANDFDNVNQRLKNSFDGTLVVIGERLLPQYGEIAGSLGDLMKGIKVGVDSGAFDPLFDYLDSVGTALSVQLAGIAKAFPDAMKMIDLNGLINALKELGVAFGSYLGDLDLTKPKDLAAVIQFLIDGITGLIRVTSGMVESFRPFISQIADFVISMAQADDETQKTAGQLLGFAKAISMAGTALFIAIMAADEFGVSMAGAFNVAAGSAQALWNVMAILKDAIKMSLLHLENSFVSFFDTITFGKFDGLKGLKETISKQLDESAMSMNKSYDGLDRGLEKIVSGFTEVGKSAEDGASKTKRLRDQVTGIMEEPAEKILTVKADEKTITDADKKITAGLPARTVEVLPKVDKAKLKEQSDIVQKAIEWKAKIDIAQIEAASKALEATFKNLESRTNSTGQAYDSIIKGLTDPSLRGWMRTDLESMLKQEIEYRSKAMEQGSELADQQIQLNKLKLEKLKEGGAAITVQADGLKPHLEMILWEVLEACQIRASESQAEFLLGWNR